MLSVYALQDNREKRSGKTRWDNHAEAGDGARTDLMEKTAAMAETNLRREGEVEWRRGLWGRRRPQGGWKAYLKGTSVSRGEIFNLGRS
jgi:hypothetical protein